MHFLLHWVAGPINLEAAKPHNQGWLETEFISPGVSGISLCPTLFFLFIHIVTHTSHFRLMNRVL